MNLPEKVTELNYFIFAPAIFLSLFLVSCTDDQDSENVDFGQTATVEAVDFRAGALPLVHRTTGEMRARNQVEIYPEINATVTQVWVNDGDQVSEGDTLLQLRDAPIREQLNQAQHDYEITRAQLRQAEANLRRLEAQYTRTRELTERELEAALELETLEADIDAAEASVDLARSQMERAASQVEEQRTNLENTVVRAPVNGVVGNRNAEVGQRVDTGTRLFQIGDVDNMRIYVMLTERMSNAIQPGNRAELASTIGSDNPVEATVERISPFLDPVTHTTIAQLEVDQNSDILQPGMFVTIDIFYGETEQTTLIPQTALYDHPMEGETGVFVADISGIEQEIQLAEDDTEERRQQLLSSPIPVQFVPVEVHAQGRGMAGISGVDELNNWVVTIGQHQLAEWGSEQAYVRKVDWEHVLDLQGRQTRDMERIIFGNNN